MTPYYQDDLVTIYHGDCLDIVPGLKRADAVVTDPPFFMPAAHYGGGNWSSDSIKKSWGDASILGQWWALVLDAVLPRLGTTGSLVSFCSDASYPVMYPPTFRRFDSVSVLVWFKDRMGVGQRWRRSYEMLMYARQTDSFWRPDAKDRVDVLTFSPTPGVLRVHPVDKPVELLAYVIDPITPLNGVVLDPFMGGGSTLVAAKTIGRRAIGIDTEEKWCEVAALRCSQEVLGLAV